MSPSLFWGKMELKRKEIVEYLEHLKELESYSEEIPEEIMHSNRIINGKVILPKYKCRKGWFMGVIGYSELLEDGGYLKAESKKLSQQITEYLKRTTFNKRLTTSEDIKRGNELLKTVIGDLEQLLNQKP